MHLQQAEPARTIPQDKPFRCSWSRAEFCARHDISFGLFHKLVNSGQLRARKIGSKTVVAIEDEAAWLRSLPAAA